MIFGVILFIAIVLSIVGIVSDNYKVAVRREEIYHKQLPYAFDGFTILQISDINGQYQGNYQSRLLDAIDSAEGEYDIVILTGDYISNPESDDFRPVMDVLEHLPENIPVFYCLGERDYAAEVKDIETSFRCYNPTEKNELMREMEKAGANFIYPLRKITRRGSSIFLTGTAYNDDVFSDMDFDMDRDFSICVTHCPITYNVSSRLVANNAVRLTEVDYDVCLSGHTMGGIIRLPLLGAVYTASGGPFPQEDITYGLHTDDAGRVTYITSGLGCTENVTFRVLNTPEIALLTLRKSEK